LAVTTTRVPVSVGVKATSMPTSSMELAQARRSPGVQVVIRPSSSSPSVYTSTIRPPTPGSHRLATIRLAWW
jgi:hypothetical protein